MTSVSVITVNYNNAEGLRRTIASVLAQSWPSVEYVVIDGGSTDGSKDVIEPVAGRLAYWVSEKDTGAYNAMNKGVDRATGDYLLFLNSGDCFENEKAIEMLVNGSDGREIVYGDLLMKHGEYGEVVTFPDSLDFSFFVNNYIPHPSTLMARDLFRRVGRYREEYVICADWVFFLTAIARADATYKHVSAVISVFFTGGLSSHSVKVDGEKERFLTAEYNFYYAGYKKMARSHRNLAELHNSRTMKLLLLFLPKRLTELIRNNPDV